MSRPASTAASGPVIAATDYMRLFADQIRPFVPRPLRVLGTDGFGRSDYRKKLRHFFEVDRHCVAVAALESAGRGRRGAGPRSWPRRSASTASIRRSRTLDGLTQSRTRRHRNSDRAPTTSPDRRRKRRWHIEVKVPDIGDFKDVPIIEIHVKAGDAVNADDPLVTLESDKATMEVPAPPAGTVEKLLVKVGDKVSEGTPIVLLAAAATAPVTQPPSLIDQQEPTPQPQPTACASRRPAGRAAATPRGSGAQRRTSRRCMPARACGAWRASSRSI